MASGLQEGVSAENTELEESEDWEYAGLEAVEKACLEIYPDQPNPLQASAVVKYWWVHDHVSLLTCISPAYNLCTKKKCKPNCFKIQDICTA